MINEHAQLLEGLDYCHHSVREMFDWPGILANSVYEMVLTRLIQTNMVFTALLISKGVGHDSYALSFAYCSMYDEPSVQIHAGFVLVEFISWEFLFRSASKHTGPPIFYVSWGGIGKVIASR